MKTVLGAALVVLFAGASFGCAEKTAGIPPMSPVSTTAGRVAGSTGNEDGSFGTLGGEGVNGSGDGVNTAGLHLSETIAKACNLPRTEPATHFAFDSSELPDEDREVLAALAKCLAGPLKDKRVLLVGRADARGEAEYNMGLGGSRSHTVRRYLVDLGVADARLTASSRGEIDAIGTDEEGFARDRRVDIDVQ